jgi:hypothetical protein
MLCVMLKKHRQPLEVVLVEQRHGQGPKAH